LSTRPQTDEETEIDIASLVRLVQLRAKVEAQQSQLAAAGAISLLSGDPNWPSPPTVIAAVIRYLESRHVHYAPHRGTLELRTALSEMLANTKAVRVDPEGILVTNGTSEAWFLTCQALLNPGDEVIIGDPYYMGHLSAILTARAVPVFLPSLEGRFAPDFNALAMHLTPRTRLVLLASPHNPSGYVLTPHDAETLAAAIRDSDVLVVNDEIYDRFIFGGARPFSPASHALLRDCTLTIDGFSKRYSMTGWRVGFVAGPRSVIDSVVEVKRAASICTSPVAQQAALAALSGEAEPYVEALVSEMAVRRSVFTALLDEAGIPYYLPDAGLTVLIALPPSQDSVHAALELAKTGVLLGPGDFSGRSTSSVLRAMLAAVDVDRLAEAAWSKQYNYQALQTTSPAVSPCAKT